jgi:hypothetical protein
MVTDLILVCMVCGCNMCVIPRPVSRKVLEDVGYKTSTALDASASVLPSQPTTAGSRNAPKSRDGDSSRGRPGIRRDLYRDHPCLPACKVPLPTPVGLHFCSAPTARLQRACNAPATRPSHPHAASLSPLPSGPTWARALEGRRRATRPGSLSRSRGK